MESGDIRDEDISASSSFDGASVGPHNARYAPLSSPLPPPLSP